MLCLFLVIACVVGLVGCAASGDVSDTTPTVAVDNVNKTPVTNPTDASSVPDENPIVAYESHVVYANWTDNKSIYANSLTPDSQYPVYTFRSKNDMNKFRNMFASILTFHKFDEVVETCDDTFFEDYAVVLTYVTAGSGSVRYSVSNVIFNNNSLDITLSVTHPEIGTCDMAGWFVMIFVPNTVLEKCTTYNVFIGDGNLKKNF